MLRIAALLFLSVLIVPHSSLLAEEVKPIETTTAEIFRRPDMFHGKLVRVKGVVDLTPEAPDESNGVTHYALYLDDDMAVNIVCFGKPAVVKGDRVRVTGKFIYDEHKFGVFFLRVDPPQGSVEKVAE